MNGEHLVLKLIDNDQLESFTKIRSSVRKHLHNQNDFSLEEVISFFESGANGNQYLSISLSNSNTLIGYARTFISEENTIFVGLDIDPMYQGFGLGRLIWERLLERLTCFPEFRIQLRVLKSNSIAHHLYIGLGFYVVEETHADVLMEISRATLKAGKLETTNVVSVMGPKDEGFVIANFEMIQKSNPEYVLYFTLVNQDQAWTRFESFFELFGRNQILVLQGNFVIDESEKALYLRARASLFHARALHLAFQTVNDYKGLVIFIDPDFYVVRREWIREIGIILSSGVTFAGAGYHPKHVTSYKNFPTPFFLCFNTNNVSLDEVDFYPDPYQREELPGTNSKYSFLHKVTKKISRYLLPITSQVTWRFKESRDTGFALRNKFANDGYFCFKVAVKNEDLFIPLFLRSKIGRYLESSVFGRTSFALMPLKINYTEISESAVSNINWDEYIFQGELFAFHVRKSNTVSSYKTYLYESVLAEVKSNLSRFSH